MQDLLKVKSVSPAAQLPIRAMFVSHMSLEQALLSSFWYQWLNWPPWNIPFLQTRAKCLISQPFRCPLGCPGSNHPIWLPPSSKIPWTMGLGYGPASHLGSHSGRWQGKWWTWSMCVWRNWGKAGMTLLRFLPKEICHLWSCGECLSLRIFPAGSKVTPSLST